MRGGSFSAAGIAVAISAAVWYFGSPLWTLNQMRAAAEARDTAAMAAHVDFPALRDSVKTEVSVAMMAEMSADDGLGPLGAALGLAMLDPVIDGLVSPAGIQMMFAGETGQGAAQAAPLDLAHDGFVIEREGFSTFRVRGEEDPEAGALIFRRDGLSWKLAAIDLPPGALSAKP